MNFSKVFEVLNDALEQKDLDLWIKTGAIKTLTEENKKLKEENEKLKNSIEELKNKKDW